MEQSEPLTALVLVAKSPRSGTSKTRLTRELAAALAALASNAAASPTTQAQLDAAQQWTEALSRASVKDLISRLTVDSYRRVLLYAPPDDAARAYFAELLREGVPSGEGEASWMLMPVLAGSNPRSSDLSSVLSDALTRVRTTTGCMRVAFLGSDCPELPLASVDAATEAAKEHGIASLCPASDGGYTFLALPAEADPSRVFEAVHWSAKDTALSQLAALSRSGLRCHVGRTHSDVDELDDLRALAARLRGAERTELCPHTAALCAEIRHVLDPGGTAEEDRDRVAGVDEDSTGAT